MRLKLNDCVVSAVGTNGMFGVRPFYVLRMWRWQFAFTQNENAVLRNLFYLNSDRQQNNMHTHTIHWNRYVRMCIENMKFMDMAVAIRAIQHAYKDPN